MLASHLRNWFRVKRAAAGYHLAMSDTAADIDLDVRIVAAYLQPDVRIRQVAEQFNVSIRRVRTALTRACPADDRERKRLEGQQQGRPAAATPEQRTAFLDRYLSGLTAAAAGREVGLNQGQVYRIIDRDQPDAPLIRRQRIAETEAATRQVAAAERDAALAALGKRCRICDTPLTVRSAPGPAERETTCSSWCAARWRQLRLIIDEGLREAHILRSFRSHAKNPKWATTTPERAAAVLAGSPRQLRPRRFQWQSETLRAAADCVARGCRPVIDALPESMMVQVRTELARREAAGEPDWRP